MCFDVPPFACVVFECALVGCVFKGQVLGNHPPLEVFPLCGFGKLWLINMSFGPQMTKWVFPVVIPCKGPFDQPPFHKLGIRGFIELRMQNRTNVGTPF